MVKFAYTILYVQDVTKAIEFYEKAFEFKRKFITPENDYGELLVGDVVLSFTSIELAKSNLSDGFVESKLENKPFGIEIGFITDDVQKVLEKAQQAGALVVEDPKLKPWGQTVAYLRDLDGFLVEVCTAMN